MGLFDDIRREFHLKCKERDEIQKNLQPLREQKEACELEVHQVEAKLKSAQHALAKAIENAKLFELDMYIAQLARAVEGKTGMPKGDQAQPPA